MLSAINDAGDLIGILTLNTPVRGNPVSFFWKRNAGVVDFSTLGDEQIIATAFNERGQVVGGSGSSMNESTRAFLWSAESGITYLGSLAPGKESQASAINESGWVVGTAIAADGSRHPFLWKPETGMQDLGFVAGFPDGDATDINDKGDLLVNFSDFLSRSHPLRWVQRIGRCTPFLWKQGEGLVELPTPPGADNVGGMALNNQGTVLLQAVSSDAWPDSIAYLIENGVLKELPSAPGAHSTWFYDLNDRGWLVGVAQTKERVSLGGFVALPVR